MPRAGRHDRRACSTSPASVEKGSEHPVGEAILARAREDELGFRPVDGFEPIAAAASRRPSTGTTVLVGSGRLLLDHGIDLGPLTSEAARRRRAGHDAGLGRSTGEPAGSGSFP